jgi:hypothetical protein
VVVELRLNGRPF